MRKLYTTYQDNNLTKLATACPSAGINLILCFSILLKGVKQLISVLFLLKDSYSWAYNRRNKSKAALILLCGIFSNGLIGQTTINLNPIKDNTIQAEGGRVDKNYGAGSVLLIDRETTKPQRALLQFNLSSIPINATITSATLTLKKVGGATGAQNISVYQITSSGNWDEGTGPDAGSMSASNWNERQAGVNWVTAGGDYNSTAESTISVSADGTYNWGVTNLVQNWVNGTYPNYGLLMWSTDGGGDRSQDFGSRENVGNEPVLTVTFITSTPGGVSGASIWLKANQGITTGATLTWADQSGNGRNGVQSTASNQPIVSSIAFNFNPALTFDGTNDYLNVQNLAGLPIGAVQVQQFAVANNLNIPGNFQHIFTYGTGTLGKAFGLAKQNGSGNAATVLYSQDAISSSSEFSGGALALLDGKYTGTNVVISSFGVQRTSQAFSSNRTTAAGYIGVDPALALSTCWNGNIPEIILYSTNLTATQVQQVNSYLAIKYGITLDQTTAQNYIGSDGTTIYWNGTTNSGYGNKIAGIARDDASALNQKQSRSSLSGFQITMGLGNTIAASNAANSNTFSADKSALIWGDNAADRTVWSATGAPANRQIIARTWKVQEIGTVGSVKIQVTDDSGGPNGLPTEGSTVILLVDADGNFASGATEVVLTLNGTNWEGNVDFTDGQYFTFATPTTLATTFTQTNVTCNGASTGAIDLSVTGGVSPYTYNWGGGITTQDRTAIPASSYNVTVTDNVSSTTTRNVTITELPILNATVNQTNVICKGGNTGTITVSSPTGGAGTYQYRLDAGAWQASGNFTGLTAASYNVQIRDAANLSCTRSLGTHLVDEPVLLYATANANNVNCNGGNDGSINLNVTGGIAPYTFNWGGGITTEDRTVLSAGVYSVTVTDANLCTTTATATVTQPAILSASRVTTQATCFSDGNIDLTPVGGTAPYTYDWADISGTNNPQDRSALTSGTYNVTVTDANGCTATASETINTPVCNPAALTICQSKTNDVFSVDPDPMVDSYTWTVPAGAVIVSGQGTPSIIVNWNGASAGAGQVCVKTVNVCSESAYLCFDVNVRSVPAAATILVAPVCTNVNLELQASGGVSYLWSGPNSFTSTNEQPILYNPTTMQDGIYAVTVTDTEGCTDVASVNVSVKNAPIATAAITLAGCLTATGVADLTVSSGVAPYTFNWSNGAVTEDISSILAGAYTVTVTDANGCSITKIAAVGNTPSPLVVPTINNIACSGGATGNISLAVSGAASPYTYNWSTGSTTQNISTLVAGFYNITVTDNLGCKTVVSNEITQPNALQLDKTFNDINCFGNMTGAINITVTGGTGGYTYDWADIAGTNNTEDRTNLAAGNYSVTVTDGNGCTISTSVTITQPAAGLSASTTVTNLLCNGVAEGVVNLTVTGGTTPYTYAWSGGVTTEDRSSVAAGTYDVTITDANGCSTTASGTVTQPIALALSHTQIDISCNGGADGSINLSVTGGTTAYTYLWSSGETTEDIASKSAGIYTITVTDANGCTATTTVTLTEPTVLASSHTVTNINCNGASTGAVDLTITGGTAPYTYIWSSGEITQDISAKIAGTYSVTITDFKNCALVTNATITQPTAISISGIVTNVGCNSGSTGAINITAIGGTGALTYNWGGGITTEDRSTLTIGTYTVMVTDANGCTATQSFSLTQPTTLALSTTSTNITCNGAANGSINLTASGGVTPFNFAWSNGATTEDLNTLNIGTYTVTVTDANGCTASTSVIISQPTTLSTTPSVSNVLCYGANTGSISTSTTGGTSPYNYAWSNGGITANINALIAGTYILTVTDANGCTTITPNTITQPVAALAITGSYVDVNCFGGNNGSITTTTTGGTLAYSYAWSNGAITPNLNALTAGTYTLTVTDNNLCTATTTFVIAQPASALSVSSTKTDVNCIGNANGSINLTVNGGTTPYIYNWSNGASTQNINALIAGTYDVTVTDAKNCTTTTSVTITQPTAISLTSSITDVTCLGGTNGVVNVTASGGVAPYTFNWSNGAITEDISSIIAGTYSVTLTDANGCMANLTNLVNDGTSPTAAIISTENSCTTDDDKILVGANATLAASGGLTYTWSTAETMANITVNPVMTTIYTVTVTDGNGCTDTEVKTIEVLTAPTAAIVSTENSCAPNDDKILTGSSVSLEVTGGLTYNWDNGLGTNGTQNVNPTVTTTYAVTVTDVNGCTDMISKTITVVSAPNASVAATESSCTTNDDKIISGSSAILTASGGSTYTWNTAEITTGITVNPLSTTTYTVTATDANGCIDISNKTIAVVTPPTAIIAITETSCTTNDDKILSGAAATLTANGGLNYTWSTAETTSAIVVNPTVTSTYTVTATDANGCTDITIKTINIVSKPTVAIAANESSCATDDDKILSGAAATLTASGSGSSYAWNTAETTTAITVNPTATITYTVTATDGNGCTNISVQTIEVIFDAYISIDITENSCAINDDKVFSGATATLTAAGGVSYTWNTTETTTAITKNPLATTTYSVTAMDINGCIGNASKTVDVITGPSATIVEVDSSCTFNDDKVLSSEGATLTASGGVSYEWSTNEFSADITVFPTVTTTYIVTITDASGCTDIASKTITVINPPTVSIASNENSCTTNDDKILNGGSVNLIANGGVSYVWDNGLGSGATQTVTPSVSTTYMVTVTDINGCTDTSSKTITIIPQPTAAIAGILSIVRGDSTILTASGGNSYIWNTTETTAPITVTPAITTSYTVTITDTDGCTDTKTVVILVDDYAIAQGDNITISEDSSLVVINVITNDVFGNDGPSTSAITITQMPTNGTASVDDNGTPNDPTDDKINYIPNANFNGIDTLIYQICDLDGDCDTALVVISVTPINDAPVAINDVNLTNEDTPISGTVATNDSDTEGDALTFTAITTVPASEGILVFNPDGTYTFTPASDFNGTVTISYQVCDATSCDTATLIITVNAVNDAPVAVDDVNSTNEDTPVSGTVATNDTDTEGDALTFTAITTVAPSEGVLVFNPDGTYTFTPANNFNGVVVVSYQVCDATKCDTAILTITVNAVNDAPVAIDDVNATNEDTPVSGTVASNDTDTEEDALTFTAITTVPASEGVLIFNPDGTYTFTPATNFNGVVVVSYQVCDATLCDTAILTITVVPVNDAPVAVDDNISTNEDTPVSGTVATNDTDTEGDALTFTAITTVPASEGVLVFNPDGTYTFTPATNFNGVVVVSYQVCDATLCDTAILTITVIPVNDAPVAIDDVNSTNEDTPVSGTVATNDTDTEGDALTFTAITTVPASEGVLVFNPDGTYTFTPANNFNGTVTISYQVCDATLCDTATLIITVNAINDAPVAINDVISTNEDTPISGTVATNDTDTEGDALTFTAITIVPATEGVLIFNPDGTYTFTPATNFNGVVVVSYQVCDATLCDTAILTITVIPVNDAPIAVDDYIQTDEEVSVSGTVATNDSDPDGDAMTFTAITVVPEEEGIFTMNPDGTYTFEPAIDFYGTVIIQYVVCDIFNACDTAILIIKVKPVSDAPIADDAINNTRNDTPVSGTLVPNVYVSDKTTGLTFGQVGTISPTGGTIIINPDGTYTFTPNPNFVGVVTVVYVVCAGVNACDTATLIITVTPTNQPPIANDDTNTTYKNNPVSGDVTPNDSDPDGNTLVFNISPVTFPTNGTVVLNSDGTYTYTPNNGFVGTDVFTYQFCDNGFPTKCDTAKVTITVIDLPKTITSTIENTLIVQVTDTICLDTRELIGKKFTIANICPSSGQIVEYSIITGTLCVKMVAIAKGDDRGCFVVCDEFGLCDTTYIVTKVVDRAVTKRIKAFNDEVTTKKGEPVISVVMSNDSLYNEGVKDVVVVVQGNHGQAEVDSSNNIIYTPEANFCGTDSITYQICSAAGCDMAVVKIKVICNGFNVYNGFSPNNDGMNDTFVIEGLENFPNNKIEIYNRWGNRVYFSKNYQNDWGGTWGNKKLPDGTYYYLIDDGEGNHYTGYIQIHQ